MSRFLWTTLLLLLLAGCAGYPIDANRYVGPQSTDAIAPAGLTYYQPAKSAVIGPPILLVPDVFENRQVFDLDGLGLAPYLAGKGFSVYALNWPAPSTNWDLDHLADSALPKAIEAVIKEKGERPVLIAHGTGAMVAFRTSARQSTSTMAGIVAVGAGHRFILPNASLDLFLKRLNEGEPESPASIKEILTSTCTFSMAGKDLGTLLLLNEKDFDNDLKKRYLDNALQALPKAAAEQLADWKREIPVTDRDFPGKVTCKVLFIAGRIDNLADPYEALVARKEMGADRATVEIFSLVNGYKEDYGHVGLLLGPHAHQDVFPVVLAWILSQL